MKELKEISAARELLRDEQKVSSFKLIDMALGLAKDEEALRKLMELRKHLEPNRKVAVARLSSGAVRPVKRHGLGGFPTCNNCAGRRGCRSVIDAARSRETEHKTLGCWK